ncbi:hypothetical protein PSMK_21980 [Phycisphaera mikurensis NBRC 102666]|uniref:Uncharacterized protein n=1 Tax=Phycisphaera mikurensis (strain NBRC 102666 / KCTC 22515 / FYK2301M01) TaxID=1142394 RepID=I0IGG9_PHYMF|nr:hypothetical protein PSMK_21980 [Phycisphaera mikurensis NBRC 102666]
MGRSGEEVGLRSGIRRGRQRTASREEVITRGPGRGRRWGPGRPAAADATPGRLAD